MSSMDHSASIRIPLTASEWVYHCWYDGLVTGAVHCSTLGWNYLWMVDESHFCDLRIYRAVPISAEALYKFVRFAIEFMGMTGGYSCIDPDRRVMPPIPLADKNATRPDDDDPRWGPYKSGQKALEKSAWEEGKSQLRYLASSASMRNGIWLSEADVPTISLVRTLEYGSWLCPLSDYDDAPESSFEPVEDQRYWDMLIAQLEVQSG